MSDHSPALRATAPGKVVLFGEYAVLEGGAALVASSERQVSAEWLGPLPSPKPHLRSYLLTAPSLGEGRWEGALSDEWGLSERLYQAQGREEGAPFSFAWAALRALNAPSGHYRVDSDALGVWEPNSEGGLSWRKLGLGSSAASVSALVSLGAQLTGRELSSAERYQLTQRIHHYVQGALGSGVDAAASAYGGLLRYRWRPGAQPLAAPLEGWERLEVRGASSLIGRAELKALSCPLPALAFVWMGRSASTRELVAQAQAYQAREPHAYRSLMEAISHAEALASSALSLTEPEARQRAFCEAVAEGGRAAQSLTHHAQAQVWTPEHSALQSLISPLGASLKSTGAGGGDLALACAPSLEAHQALLSLCASEGWELITL